MEPTIAPGVYITGLSTQGKFVYGLDNNKDVWEWGNHRIKNDSFIDVHGKKFDGSTPFRLRWFGDNGKDIKQVRCGDNVTIILAQDRVTKKK